jgi:hypothetical protein
VQPNNGDTQSGQSRLSVPGGQREIGSVAR